MDKKVNVITDLDGSKIVLINDIRFKSRRSFDWDTIEEYIKEYIGQFFEIIETCEKVYIGSDFPDEFCHSEDRIKTNGKLLRYNIFSARMLVRCDKNENLYLYDFIRIKKETCSPPG